MMKALFAILVLGLASPSYANLCIDTGPGSVVVLSENTFRPNGDLAALYVQADLSTRQVVEYVPGSWHMDAETNEVVIQINEQTLRLHDNVISECSK